MGEQPSIQVLYQLSYRLRGSESNRQRLDPVRSSADLRHHSNGLHQVLAQWTACFAHQAIHWKQHVNCIP